MLSWLENKSELCDLKRNLIFPQSLPRIWATITHDHDCQNLEKRSHIHLMIVSDREMIGNHNPFTLSLLKIASCGWKSLGISPKKLGLWFYYYVCLKAKALEKLQSHLFENAQKRTIYLTKRPCKKKCGCFACKFRKMVIVKWNAGR